MNINTEVQEEVVLPATGLSGRAGVGLNCAAKLGPNRDRECRRGARQGDYCVQHWLMNYGHEFNLLTWICKCGAKWDDESVPEVCFAKVSLVRFSREPLPDPPTE